MPHPRIIIANKLLAETPLQAVIRSRYTFAIGPEIPVSYAGRLDPAAEGLLLLLVGGENRHRHAYEYVSKTYRATFLVGVATDSADLLGVPTLISPISIPISLERCQRILNGGHLLSPPAYSSVSIDGKPLYAWTKQGITKPMPSRLMSVYQADVIHHSADSENVTEAIATTQLLERITYLTSHVSGDFRQPIIQEVWAKELITHAHTRWHTLSLTLTVKSGTYIRSLVTLLSYTLGIPLTLYQLIRTRVGPYSLPLS